MKETLARCGLATAAVGAVALGLVGGPAASAEPDAGAAQGPAPAKIVMKFNGEKQKLFFAGSKEVVAGQPLKIVNTVKPSKHGPHTFSLVQESLRPSTRAEGNRCFAPGKLCRRIAVAHKVDFDTFAIGQPVVKVGKSGWDRMFTKDAKGDSWFTAKLGATLSQKVTAAPGTSLDYFCAIHPEMKGTIDVVE